MTPGVPSRPAWLVRAVDADRAAQRSPLPRLRIRCVCWDLAEPPRPARPPRAGRAARCQCVPGRARLLAPTPPGAGRPQSRDQPGQALTAAARAGHQTWLPAVLRGSHPGSCRWHRRVRHGRTLRQSCSAVPRSTCAVPPLAIRSRGGGGCRPACPRWTHRPSRAEPAVRSAHRVSLPPGRPAAVARRSPNLLWRVEHSHRLTGQRLRTPRPRPPRGGWPSRRPPTPTALSAKPRDLSARPRGLSAKPRDSAAGPAVLTRSGLASTSTSTSASSWTRAVGSASEPLVPRHDRYRSPERRPPRGPRSAAAPRFPGRWPAAVRWRYDGQRVRRLHREWHLRSRLAKASRSHSRPRSPAAIPAAAHGAGAARANWSSARPR